MTENRPEQRPASTPLRHAAVGIREILDQTQSNLILRLDAWRLSKHLPVLGLPTLYCLVALFFLTLFATEAFLLQQTGHGRILLMFALMTVGCFVYLRISGDSRFTNMLIVSLLGLLCLYLLISGGIDGTGPLWYFVFPLVALFIQRLWAGILSIIILFTLTWLLIRILEPGLYTQAFLERLLAVYIAISIMAFFYAYIRTSAQLVLDNMNRTYSNQANTDILTRLANRRRMTEVLYQEVSRTLRNNSTFSIINFDIDHFKKINDEYGHDAGDKILATVPKVVRSILRTQDVCSRWGGEEFLVLLPDTALAGASQVAERLRKAFEQFGIDHDGRLLSVTVSIGVYEFSRAKSLEDCLKQADKNMYKAKSSGRNCVIAG